MTEIRNALLCYFIKFSQKLRSCEWMIQKYFVCYCIILSSEHWFTLFSWYFPCSHYVTCSNLTVDGSQILNSHVHRLRCFNFSTFQLYTSTKKFSGVRLCDRERRAGLVVFMTTAASLNWLASPNKAIHSFFRFGLQDSTLLAAATLACRPIIKINFEHEDVIK